MHDFTANLFFKINYGCGASIRKEASIIVFPKVYIYSIILGADNNVRCRALHICTPRTTPNIFQYVRNPAGLIYSVVKAKGDTRVGVIR